MNRLARAVRLGSLDKFLDRERATTPQRMAAAALPYKQYVRPKDSEHELRCVVDARTWFRWYLTDRHFWHDDANVNRFVKDNPISAPWKG